MIYENTKLLVNTVEIIPEWEEFYRMKKIFSAQIFLSFPQVSAC